MAWKCSCGLTNAGIVNICVAESIGYKKGVRHSQVSPNTVDWTISYLAAKELDMTPQEELFAKSWNEQKVLVKDMDLFQLREHREVLQKIALESKARLQATDEELRERKAKTANKEWLVTESEPSQTVTDAVNAVKRRANRISKMDKIKDQLSKYLDEATVKQMVKEMEQKATDKNLKTIVFKKTTTDVAAVQVKTEKNGDSTPFNPLSLGFACKDCKQNPCRCDGLTPVLA